LKMRSDGSSILVPLRLVYGTHLGGYAQIWLMINPVAGLKCLHHADARLTSYGLISRAKYTTLVGKLGWIFLGKHGRAATQPLRELLKHDTPATSQDTARARSCLSFLEDMFAGELHRVIYYGAGQLHAGVVTIFSDASWHPQPPLLLGVGCVAFIVFLPQGDILFSSSMVPTNILRRIQELRPRLQPINSLETMALTGSYFFNDADQAFMDRRVNHFSDNNAANWACVKGYSPFMDIALMVNVFTSCAVRRNTQVWHEYVPSNMNLADEPSRGVFDNMERLHARRVPFRFPDLRYWNSWSTAATAAATAAATSSSAEASVRYIIPKPPDWSSMSKTQRRKWHRRNS